MKGCFSSAAVHQQLKGLWGLSASVKKTKQKYLTLNIFFLFFVVVKPLFVLCVNCLDFAHLRGSEGNLKLS